MTDAEAASLADSISKKVLAILVRAGLLNKDGEVVTNPDSDEMFRDHEALAAASSASIAGKIAFGPNAGRHVTKVGSGFGYYEETPLAKGRLCYSVNGFSLHCNTAVNTHSRDAGSGPRLGLNQARMCWRRRHENRRGGEVYSKCGVGKENARDNSPRSFAAL